MSPFGRSSAVTLVDTSTELLVGDSHLVEVLGHLGDDQTVDLFEQVREAEQGSVVLEVVPEGTIGSTSL